MTFFLLLISKLQLFRLSFSELTLLSFAVDINVIFKDVLPSAFLSRWSKSLRTLDKASVLYEQVASEKLCSTEDFDLFVADQNIEDYAKNGQLIKALLSLDDHTSRLVVEVRYVKEMDFASARESTGYSSTSERNGFISATRPVFSYSTGPKCKFVGLSNQGATCYMNSLLQSLFMTPEFREGVYQITVEQDPVKQKDSICFQLQYLFAQMQLSEKHSVETKGLTRSFGWSGADAFQQHDVQELCRVLFDELEERLKGTPKEHLIKDLFEGIMESYVRNIPGAEVKFESLKEEPFMDLSLNIKQFGNPHPIKSVEEGLANFIKPETLDGNNQYQLDPDPANGRTEKMMVDAYKGLQLADLPYILTIQLKRFDFDYETMRRIKITDRVTFPEMLDASSYLCRNPKRKRRMSITEDPPDEQDGESQRMEGDSNLHTSSNCEPSESARNPLWYDLYSVMVHSGSAFGGHYYAYVKDLAEGRWYKFNDAMVTEACWQDVESTFGAYGATTTYLTTATAYMLSYRRREDSRKVQRKLEVPEASNKLRRFLFHCADLCLQELAQAIKISEEALKREEEELRIKRNTWQINVFHGFYHSTVNILKDQSYHQLLERVRESLNSLKDVDVDCIRLRKYNPSNDLLGLPVLSDEEDNPAIESILSCNINLAVETRVDLSMPWKQFQANSSPVRVWLSRDIVGDVDSAILQFSDENDIFYLQEEDTVLDLKRLVMHQYGVDVGELVVAKYRRHSIHREVQFPENATRLKRMFSQWEEDFFFVAKIKSEMLNSLSDVHLFKNSIMSPAVLEASNKIKILFNDLQNQSVGHSIITPISDSLQSAKERMSSMLETNCEKFKILRKAENGMQELNRMQMSLADLGISRGGEYITRLHVEVGAPSKASIYQVQLHLVDSVKQPLSWKELSTVEIDDDLTVAQIKVNLIENLPDSLKCKIDSTDGIPHLRLRSPSMLRFCPELVDEAFAVCLGIHGSCRCFVMI